MEGNNMAFFFYTREAEETKKDEQGKPIPITMPVKQADGTTIDVPVDGKFEKEKVLKTDVLNIKNIIRVHMINNNHVVVLLNDGHETTEKTPQLRNPKKPATPDNIMEVKERIWVQSEISIKGEEVMKLYSVLEKE